MANWAIPVTVPDDKVSLVQDAMHWHFGQNMTDPDNPVPYTTAELKALLDEGVRNSIKDIVKRYQKQQAVDAISIPDTDIQA